MLQKVTNGKKTKYVYGLGLIGEEKQNCGFKTYHYDLRGSTVAITNMSGTVTDTFTYDTYGKMTSHTGSTFVIFGYNGRDGVVTDVNGLIYMRARYYSPELRRFVNTDIVAGEITNGITLNRYAYANANPVTNVDPLGLMVRNRFAHTVHLKDGGGAPIVSKNETTSSNIKSNDYVIGNNSNSPIGSGNSIVLESYPMTRDSIKIMRDGLDVYSTSTELAKDSLPIVNKYLKESVLSAPKPKRIPKGSWINKTRQTIKTIDDVTGPTSKASKALDTLTPGYIDAIIISVDTGLNICENIDNGTDTKRIVTDAITDVTFGVGGVAIGAAVGSAIGSVVPVAGTAAGAAIGVLAGIAVDAVYELVTDTIIIEGQTGIEWAKDGLDWIADQIFGE